jgi:hypothetical protein
MHTRTTIAALAAIATMFVTLASADEEAPANVTMNGGSTAIGVGGNWGEGTFTFKGYSYPFVARGLAIGDLGATAFTASGVVYNAQRPEDFDGNYVGLSAGLTVAGGGQAFTLRNQHGVTMHLIVTTRGLDVDLAGRGIEVYIPESSYAAVRAQQAAETAAVRAEDAAQRVDAAAGRIEGAADRIERIAEESARRAGPRRSRPEAARTASARAD